MDYWEEVTAEDGSPWFYNHTSQEYASSLPSNNATAPSVESPVAADYKKAQSGTAAWGRGNENDLENWGGQQVWDGVDGEVFVPWPEEEPQEAMKASPEVVGSSDDILEKPEAGERIFFLVLNTSVNTLRPRGEHVPGI